MRLNTTSPYLAVYLGTYLIYHKVFTDGEHDLPPPSSPSPKVTIVVPDRRQLLELEALTKHPCQDLHRLPISATNYWLRNKG